jgi:hypothetical protein
MAWRKIKIEAIYVKIAHEKKKAGNAAGAGQRL